MDIAARVWSITNKYSAPPLEVRKVAKSVCMVDIGHTKFKVRETYTGAENWSVASFQESMEVHKMLQGKVYGVPKIIKFIDKEDWKYKFVEWMEGETFAQFCKRFGSNKDIPIEYFHQFGRFMWKVKQLGWYGQDGHWGNPFYRTDKKRVIVCDYGVWSFSRNQKYEEPFIDQFLGYATKVQRRAFYDGYEYTAKKY